MKRIIVSVATGRFTAAQDRLRQALSEVERGADLLFWRDSLPPGSPTHQDVPFGFKAFAMKHVLEKGYESALWLDSPIIPLRSLVPLWELIEAQGYWFSANPPYDNPAGLIWNCGQWTCDSALAPLGVTREELFPIPHVIGGAFGLKLGSLLGRAFFDRYLRLAEDGTAFRGPIANNNGEASPDPRVLGHRHDQTVASVLAHRLGMKLTQPPKWVVDGTRASVTEETVLWVDRV